MTDRVPARRKMRRPLRAKRTSGWLGPAEGGPAATAAETPGQETRPPATDFRELLHRCPAPLWVQRDDVLCFVNLAARHFFFAADDAALVGVHWHRLVEPGDWATTQDLIAPGTPDILPRWAPIKLLALDGSMLGADICATNADFEGRPATLVMLRGDPGHPSLEQGLRQQKARLEQELAERTADLQQALADAQRADGNRDAVLVKVSQELRTPLAGMIGLLEVALGQCRDADLRESLQRMSQAASKLSRVIDDLLDFAQVASGRMDLEAVAFGLRELLRQVREANTHKAEAKGLQLSFVIADDVPDMLIGDPRRIGQILRNLVDNAIKFTNSGSVAVHAVVASRGDTDVSLAFDVRDTGIGLGAEEHARLFQAFAGDPERRPGSTGLGLALSQRLAEAMGGRITVRSRKGEGSSFCLGLRLRLAAPPAASTAAGTIDRRGARVLLVDDDPVCVEIVVELLRPLDIHPRVAENGHEAIKLLSQEGSQGVDLILMDLQMPVLDGCAATQVIRSWKDYAAVPIVALTADSRGSDRRRATAAGMSDYLAKPFDQATLFAMLDKWLPRSAATADADTGAAPPPPAATPARGPAEAFADAGRQPLASLNCLDAAAGLSRFVGNIERYRHWLGRFVTTSAAMPPEVRAALTAGDRTHAAEISHAFKGNVATLGFEGLRVRAEALEIAIRQGQSAVPELRQLERAIDDARREVAAALGIAVDAL